MNPVSGINKVTTVQGWLWLKSAFELFLHSPLNWLAMCIVLFIGTLIIGMIPLASLVLQIILPVFTAGLMLAAHNLQQGQNIHLGYLIAGFKLANARELFTLGFIALLANIVIMALATLIIMLLAGDAMKELVQTYQPGTIPPPEQMGSLLLYALLLGTLSIPLLMGLWFAPALISLRQLTAREAFVTSFNACARNMGAFTLYGGALLILTFLAIIPFGVGLLLLVPVTLISMYTAYRTIFSI